MRRKHIVVGERRPRVPAGIRSATPEAIHAAIRRHAYGVATPLREKRGMLERRGELATFSLESLPRVAFQPRVGKARRESDDDQDDQHLDQRESSDPPY